MAALDNAPSYTMEHTCTQNKKQKKEIRRWNIFFLLNYFWSANLTADNGFRKSTEATTPKVQGKRHAAIWRPKWLLQAGKIEQHIAAKIDQGFVSKHTQRKRRDAKAVDGLVQLIAIVATVKQKPGANKLQKRQRVPMRNSVQKPRTKQQIGAQEPLADRWQLF
jgi:hypothetical protein